MFASLVLLLAAAFLPSSVLGHRAQQQQQQQQQQEVRSRDDSASYSSSSSSDMTALAAALPSCGLNCFVAALSNSTCADAACMCTNEVLQEYITVCVTYNCTLPEQLTVKNVTNTACGVPVRDAGPPYNAVNIILGSVSAAVLLLRVVYKTLVARITLGMDDYFIMATLCSGVPGTVITSLGTIANGLGRDIWTLPASEITSFVYWFYHMEYEYFLNLALLKMSLLFFYLKIFPNRGVRVVLWATIGYNAVWGVAFILLAIFQCRPISYYWTGWDGLHEGTCLDANSLGWANAITSIVLDIWMLAIPLMQLRSLQLHIKKKVGVAIMFSTGTFVTVVSVVRLQSLVTFSNSSNPTWDNLRVSQWSTIEVNVGIICACMPTLRLILLKIFPSLSSTTRNYGTNPSFGDKYGRSGLHHQSSGLHASNRSQVRGGCGDDDVEAGLKRSAGGGGSRIGRPGITYQRSYTVHYDDAETSSQVQLKDLDHKGIRLSDNFQLTDQDPSPLQQHPVGMI